MKVGENLYYARYLQGILLTASALSAPARTAVRHISDSSRLGRRDGDHDDSQRNRYLCRSLALPLLHPRWSSGKQLAAFTLLFLDLFFDQRHKVNFISFDDYR